MDTLTTILIAVGAFLILVLFTAMELKTANSLQKQKNKKASKEEMDDEVKTSSKDKM